MNEHITPAIGQKWRDLDRRMNGRVREIVAIGSDQDGTVRWAWYSNGYRTKIRVRADRLRKPFWELVT